MPLEPGFQLDAYVLDRPLGAGGMGEVWLATETRLGRKVALKLLPPEVTIDPARVTRFEQEARAASGLNHPNVCTILALGESAGGQRYIAMEHVEGNTLRRRLAAGPLRLRDALDIAIQVAAALSAAHAVGIVHRDIKPENVMIRPDGFVKVLDFGLAKLLPARELVEAQPTETAFRTEAGTVIGTIAYMSPEQARGEALDARTDIWSLGCVLYEMVAGRPPFAARSSSDTLAAILEHDPDPLARFDLNVPGELQRIVGKALQKDPDERYQVIKDLQLDLKALRNGLDDSRGEALSPAARTSSSGTQSRFRRGAVLAGLAVVFVAATGLAAVWWGWARRPAQDTGISRGTGQRHLTRLTFGAGLQTDATFSPDGRFIAYASDRAGNFDIWVQPIAQGEPIQVTSSVADETQPDWSPDGTRIAYRSEADGGGIHLVPALGGAERRLTAGGFRPRFSPDGRLVMYLGSLEHETTNVIRPDVFLIPSTGGVPRRTFDLFWDQVEAVPGVAWHPDGTRLSFIGSYADHLVPESHAHDLTDIGSCELGVAPGRIALTIRDATGSIWMVEDVDK